MEVVETLISLIVQEDSNRFINQQTLKERFIIILENIQDWTTTVNVEKVILLLILRKMMYFQKHKITGAMVLIEK